MRDGSVLSVQMGNERTVATLIIECEAVSQGFVGRWCPVKVKNAYYRVNGKVVIPPLGNAALLVIAAEGSIPLQPV